MKTPVRCSFALLVAAAFGALPGIAAAQAAEPLQIEKQGAFAVGGKIAGDAATSSLH